MFLFMLKMVLSLFLVGLFLQTPVRTADAFTAAFARRKAAEWVRSALIYMPDGTKVVEDDPTVTDVDWMATSTSNTIDSPLLEYLNRPDFRGPLAVLCAAQKHIDITTIQHVHVKAVSPSAISIEAICASADGMTCVNVLVEMEFPTFCQSENEVIENLGVLHQQASAVLEQRELLEQAGVGEDSKRLAEGKEAEEGMAQESKVLAAKQVEEAKQRTLLEARLRHEEKVRASIRECQSKRNAILEARQQPKSPEVEEALKAKYGAMSLQDRAFCILVDLGMVEITPDP